MISRDSSELSIGRLNGPGKTIKNFWSNISSNVVGQTSKMDEQCFVAKRLNIACKANFKCLIVWPWLEKGL